MDQAPVPHAITGEVDGLIAVVPDVRREDTAGVIARIRNRTTNPALAAHGIVGEPDDRAPFLRH